MDWIFRQLCQLKSLTGHDGWNTPAYSPAATTPCRFQFKKELVRDKNGKEVMSRTQVWLPADIIVKPDDVLVYPVGGEEYEVITTGGGVDLHGATSYIKAWC